MDEEALISRITQRSTTLYSYYKSFTTILGLPHPLLLLSYYFVNYEVVGTLHLAWSKLRRSTYVLNNRIKEVMDDEALKS